MTQEEFDGLIGRTEALSAVLTTVISTLPALSAARAALELKIEQETQRQEDQAAGTPKATSDVRNAILDSYVGLLSSVAKNG